MQRVVILMHGGAQTSVYYADKETAMRAIRNWRDWSIEENERASEAFELPPDGIRTMNMVLDDLKRDDTITHAFNTRAIIGMVLAWDEPTLSDEMMALQLEYLRGQVAQQAKQTKE